jgi:hypothetical protein
MEVPNRRYSVPITTDTMAPRCMPGQMAVADPERAVEVDCEVLVITRSEDADHALAGWFGRLVRRGIDQVEIKQLNPPITIAFNAEKVVAIHRVVGIFDAVVKL